MDNLIWLFIWLPYSCFSFSRYTIVLWIRFDVVKMHFIKDFFLFYRRHQRSGSHPLRICMREMESWMVTLTWLCCFKEVAITGVTSKLLTSKVFNSFKWIDDSREWRIDGDRRNEVDSWLVCWTPDEAVRVRALLKDIVFRSSSGKTLYSHRASLHPSV